MGLVGWGINFGAERLLTTPAFLELRRMKSAGGVPGSVSLSGLGGSGYEHDPY